MKKALTYGLLCLFIAACAKKENYDAPTVQEQILVQNIPATSIEAASFLAKQAKLQCENQDCPDGIAMLVATKTNGLSTCTSFLIAEDTILTNSHCIPEEIKSDPSLCSTRIHFIFPATADYEEETVNCTSLTGFSDVSFAKRPDMAMIKVAPTNRHALVKGEGVKQTLKVYKIDPTSQQQAEGILKSAVCQSAEGTFAFPPHKNKNSNLVAIGDCYSELGNSGSPVLNENNEVVAIMQSRLELKGLEKILSTNMLEGESIAPMATATNTSCLVSTKKWQLRTDCLPNPETEEDIPLFGHIKDILSSKKYSSALDENVLPYLPEQYSWNRVNTQTSASRLEQNQTVSPICMNKLPETEIESFSRPYFTAKVFFNRYLQPTLRMENLQHSISTIALDTIANPAEGFLDGETLFLSFCPQTQQNLP